MGHLTGFFSKSLLLILFISLGGCLSLPNESIDRVGNRKVSYSAKGSGTPVVVLEAGLGSSMTTWAPVFERISEFTAVYVTPGQYTY